MVVKTAKPLQFTNAFSDCPEFVSLGPYNIGTVKDGCQTSERYDLYALPYFSGKTNTISFGARYGNRPEEYKSGEAYLNDKGEWKLMVGRETGIAAARFFANHWNELRG